MADHMNKLEKLVEWIETAEEASLEARKQAETDRDYYDNKQWTDQEIAALQKRGQPVVTINRIKRKVDFLIGVETQQRSDPKAFPRNPHDEAASFAATDSIRFVLGKNRWDVLRSRLWRDLLIYGACGVEVLTREGQNGFEIDINQYAWDRLGWDPYSSEEDFTDARYKYVVVWKDKDDLLSQYPDAEEIIENSLFSNLHSDTYDDRPKHKIWSDRVRQRIRVVLIYYREQEDWRWALLTKGGILDEGDVPYLNDEGSSECPLIMTSAYVDRENNRYGIVREMRSPQDEINKRRSKALHLLSTRQIIADRGAVESVRRVKAELAKPDGYIEKNPQMNLEILQTGDLTGGHFQLLQEAKGEIDMMGPNPAMEGRGGADQSGRAILAQQQSGYIELGQLTDRLRQMSLLVYRAVWNRIRQYWNEERWIRVTDNENNLKFVGLNRPVSAGEVELQKLQDSGLAPQELEHLKQQIQSDPAMSEIIRYENTVGDLDVDIILEEVPDTVTIRHEQFRELTSLAASGIPIPPDVLIEASSLRNKKELLQKLQGSQPDPMQQKMMELELAEKEAEIQKLRADAEKKQAEAAVKQIDAGLVPADGSVQQTSMPEVSQHAPQQTIAKS